MSDSTCSCGHSDDHHRYGGRGCQSPGCECRESPKGALPGVYHLDSARTVLRMRSGRSLLQRRAAEPSNGG